MRLYKASHYRAIQGFRISYSKSQNLIKLFPFFYSILAYMEFESETRIIGKPIILGILGKLETLSKEDIHEKILHPLMSVLRRLPDKVLIPSEGQSSAYLSIWSERQSVETQILEADWRKFQRRAIILRDSRILKEASHLLIFGGIRSDRNKDTAMREARKGKQVFFIEPNPVEFYEVVVE